MFQIRTLIFSAAVAAFAVLFGGQAMAAEGVSGALAAGVAPKSLILVKDGGGFRRGGGDFHRGGGSFRHDGGGMRALGSHRMNGSKAFSGMRMRSGPKHYAGPKVRNWQGSGGWVKSVKGKHRRHHHRRHYRRHHHGGVWWATPLFMAPYYYGDDYGWDYDSCYWNCRRFHGPRYCRRHWRRYCD